MVRICISSNIGDDLSFCQETRIVSSNDDYQPVIMGVVSGYTKFSRRDHTGGSIPEMEWEKDRNLS